MSSTVVTAAAGVGARAALAGPVALHSPSGAGLPGTRAIDQIISWTMYGGLVMLSLGVMSGFVMVGVGNLSERPHLATRGKSAVVWCLLGSAGVGVAIPLVNRFFSLA